MEAQFHRELEDRIDRFADRKEIIIIRGPRQSGKSTLLRIIGSKIAGRKSSFDLDILSDRMALEQSPIEFVKGLGEGKLTLFLDEIQRMANGGEKLKIIYDNLSDVKVFATGSSSLQIKSNILNYLVGRALVFELFTLSFSEFLMAKDSRAYNAFKERNRSLLEFFKSGSDITKPFLSDALSDLLKEYMIFGGYPEVVKSNDRDTKIALLKNIVSTHMDKDVISFFRVGETQSFANFSKAVSFNTANQFSLASISREIGISYSRASEYANILINTYIMALIRPFHRNLVTEIKKEPKLYFMDLGFRNSLMDNFSEFDNRDDKGKIAENFVFRELITLGFDVKYWRTTSKGEVDFVIKNNEELIPVEVKFGGGTPGKSLHSFIDTYKPKKAVIVTKDEFKRQEIGNTIVYWLPIFYL